MRLILPLILNLTILSAHALTIKVGALAPQGTNWAKSIKDFTKDVKKATDGKVKFKVYYGGVQGDEPDVLRKIRVGQLHGGIFTGKTLGDIYPDIRSIELPFNFYDKAEQASKALSGMSDYFEKGLNDKGFVSLGFYEIGNVYLVSTKKVTSLEELKGIKVWAWEGDKLVEAMISSLNLSPVPLSITDVHASLSTGVIDAAYAPPLGIIALQWNNKVKYLVDFPTAFSIGAFLVNKKTWDKISPENQKKIIEISNKYVEKANKLAHQDNKQGLEALKKQGVEFVDFKKSDLDKAEEMRNNAIKQLKGSFISPTAMEKVKKYRL